MFKVVTKLDKLIDDIASFLLVVSVALMLFLSVLNIFLRWGNTTIFWVEPFVRHLVFLSAFLGGILATGRKNHIGIDIIGRWLEVKKYYKLRLQVERFIYIVSIVTLYFLILSSVDFMHSEAKYGREAFLGIHSSHLVGIIPVGFSAIMVRIFLILVLSFKPTSLKKNNKED
jgi:TRAP-type C4-dicarboxylate transport system permease small subunit